MRKMSNERRRIVVLAAALASLSGVMPVLLRGHSVALRVWIGVEMVLLVVLMVGAVRLGHRNCA